MKAAIVTFVRAYNYGAVFQAYALNKKINQLGVECETIDYWPQYFRNEYNMSGLGRLYRRPFRPVKRWMKRLYAKILLIKRNYNFSRFISKNIRLSRRQYLSYDELNNDNLDYDCFIAGSDQVWCSDDPAYYLTFRSAQEKLKYSYAASFGMRKFSEDLRNEYEMRLKNFDIYSVREERGRQIIEDYLGKEAIICCDPTLLLSEKEWNELEDKRIKMNEPYILVYYVVASDMLRSSAQKLSRITGYKVICIPCNMNLEIITGIADKRYGFEVETTISPEQLLTLFHNASYVLTNSFHGTVFSIVYHKKFLVQVQLSRNNRNDRALDLMSKTGIHNRILIDENVEDIVDEIDWKIADRKISGMRTESMQYLRKILGIQKDS